jgi:hypothetical protein
LTSIADDAFALCPIIGTLVIPNSVVTIGAGAFSSTTISSLIFASSLTYIGQYSLPMKVKVMKVKARFTAGGIQFDHFD